MGYRDELIEAAAEAMWNGYANHDPDWKDVEPYRRIGMEIDAAHALNAILAKLEMPSEDMVKAGVAVGGRAWEYTGDTFVCHPSRSFPAMIQSLKP